MNKTASLVALSALLLCNPVFAETETIVNETEHLQTITNVRCWYRTDYSRDSAATDYEWARIPDGRYFTIEGYWWGNMFYTDTTQQEIRDQCSTTLGIANSNADVTYFAASFPWSLNNTIWSNDSAVESEKINKIVSFGDSLSDTGNVFGASQFRFPDRSSWFLGHFSNGFVWTEYLARAKNLPVYNWAVGGSGGQSQFFLLSGINDQIKSYLQYMDETENYNPSNTLFTLEFGLNDFMQFGRSAANVKDDFAEALVSLINSGAKNFLLITLPDVTNAPKFQYSSHAEVEFIRSKILDMNTFIQEQVNYYTGLGYNMTLFDTYELFERVISNPTPYGFDNATESCLSLSSFSLSEYFYWHSLREECVRIGSDKFVFWDSLHPTTAVHQYVAEEILASGELESNHSF
ncbi:SGNH/GDSL hydrolase family protein [Vibrio caribbeanicus]|uniref:Lipolytic enzyme n=1 Tax=Vibrio caribbeanicus ATCC BAA-2122 TaxID=796620 RepID=E3BEX5_9VIBR|nr:SGNH/GDSL hydrolase family protein [Vibrio caribbeanicus]EFP98492.1 lipolytic enzyme [Vibrio caribbeanicus ATCC BAA-2122]